MHTFIVNNDSFIFIYESSRVQENAIVVVLE